MSAVLICSPFEHTREAIKSALANHIALIVTEDPDQALNAFEQKAPIHKAFIDATILTDANLDLGTKAAALKPGVKIIALGDHDTEAIATQAVRHGASGYILLPISPAELLALARL